MTTFELLGLILSLRCLIFYDAEIYLSITKIQAIVEYLDLLFSDLIFLPYLSVFGRQGCESFWSVCHGKVEDAVYEIYKGGNVLSVSEAIYTHRCSHI